MVYVFEARGFRECACCDPARFEIVHIMVEVTIINVRVCLSIMCVECGCSQSVDLECGWSEVWMACVNAVRESALRFN